MAFAPPLTAASTIGRLPAGARSSIIALAPPLRLHARDRQQRPDRVGPQPRVVHSALAEVEPVAQTDPSMPPDGLPPALVQLARAAGGPTQRRAVHRRDFAPVRGTLRNGLDPEVLVALGDKAREVLQHADVLAAQDPFPHRL